MTLGRIADGLSSAARGADEAAELGANGAKTAARAARPASEAAEASTRAIDLPSMKSAENNTQNQGLVITRDRSGTLHAQDGKNVDTNKDMVDLDTVLLGQPIDIRPDAPSFTFDKPVGPQQTFAFDPAKQNGPLRSDSQASLEQWAPEGAIDPDTPRLAPDNPFTFDKTPQIQPLNSASSPWPSTASTPDAKSSTPQDLSTEFIGPFRRQTTTITSDSPRELDANSLPERSDSWTESEASSVSSSEDSRSFSHTDDSGDIAAQNATNGFTPNSDPFDYQELIERPQDEPFTLKHKHALGAAAGGVASATAAGAAIYFGNEARQGDGED